MKVNVENHLSLNEEVDVERQAVHGGVHGALDRVLDGNEPQVDLAGTYGFEDLGQVERGTTSKAA